MGDFTAELEILKNIIGDLSGVGLWLVAAYLFYKLTIITAIGYTIHYIVKAVSTHFKAPITRAEADALKDKLRVLDVDLDVANKIWESRLEVQRTSSQAELERVQHLYKILKEAQANDSTTDA